MITSAGTHYSGFQTCFIVTYQNKGTTILVPDVELGFDDALSFASSGIILIAQGCNNFTYQGTPLGLFETRSFSVDSTAQLGNA